MVSLIFSYQTIELTSHNIHLNFISNLIYIQRKDRCLCLMDLLETANQVLMAGGE